MSKKEKVHEESEYMFEEEKKQRNPWVPIGAFATAAVLTAGLVSFKQGNSKRGQLFMRARVVCQGATVALMLATATMFNQGKQVNIE